MIGYQPNFRPIVRAQMAQATPAPAPATAAPTVPVPTTIADSTAAAVATSQHRKTVALLSSGMGALAGAAVTYGSYVKGKNKVSNLVLMAGAFTFLNVVFFGYVLSD